MSEITTFESRQGLLSCSTEKFFNFLNDIRNFEQFIPKDKFTDITINADTCSFSVPMIGRVDVRIAAKTEFSEVVYAGSTAAVSDFSLAVRFGDAGSDTSDVKLSVTAAINPFLKMIASEPLNNMLETLVSEMERFTGWDDIRTDNLSP
jgi:carbon monoxide dehydrogenase subunit G